MVARGRGLFSLYIYIENFKNLLIRNLGPISISFCRNVPLVILYQDCSSHLDSSKNMAARGRGLFSLYICIENFKNLLVRNHWTDFHIILQKCSLLILLQDCSSHLDSLINMAARGRGLFSPYICIENFKNLLVRNHWTDFHIILQKCSFGDPLPRLFKPFGFFKKHGRQGRGLFSLYIYIENFKKSSC